MIVRRRTGYGVRVWDRATQTRRWIGTFRTLEEARTAEADARLHRTKYRQAITVEQWARIWLKEYARDAGATRLTYGYAVGQIVRELGKLRLSDVDRVQARGLARQWPRGRTRVARTMWADAVRDGICEVNPFVNLRLETPRGRKDLTALTERQIVELADLASEMYGDYGSEMRAIVLVLGYTGIRPGEMMALRSQDVDVANGRLTVARSLDATGSIKTPKNGKPRVIALPPPAAHALGGVPARLDSEFLFHSLRGKPLAKGTFAFLWRPLAAAWQARYGYRLQPYELRHACATMLLERGLDPGTVAVQLGHQDGGRLVQTLYGHPDANRQMDRVRMAFAAAPREIMDPSQVAPATRQRPGA